MAANMSKPVPVKFSEVRDAFEFANFGGFDAEAYICIASGKVHFISDSIDLEEDAPADDFEDSDDYVALPDKRSLDLGNSLVFRFAGEMMPDDYDTVRDIFRRKGAYRRFKDLLAANGMLEKWNAFEAAATEDALRAWCQETDIPLQEG
jgi:hypothetical protein